MSANTVTVEPTKTTNYKDLLLSKQAIYAGAFAAGAGLQALGMFTNNLGFLNIMSNQIFALFSNMVNAVAGNFLSAAAAGVISQALAIVAVAAAVSAIAYACVHAYNHFANKAGVAAPKQEEQVHSSPKMD